MSNINIILSSVFIGRVLTHLKNPLYRNGYALTMSSALTSLVGFAYWILAARYYSVEIVGTSTASIAAMTLIAGLSSLYLDGTLARFVPIAGKTTPKLIISVYIVLIVAATLISSIFLLGIKIWSPALGFLTSTPFLSVGFVVSTVIWTVFNIQDGALIGMRQALWIPLENAIYATAKLILLVVFSYTLPQYGVFLSWTAPIIMVIGIVNMSLFRHLVPQHIQVTQSVATPIIPSQVLKYASTNYIGIISSFVSTGLPPVMVLQLAGSRASAYFYMPWVMAGLFRVLATDTSTSLVVEGAIDPARLGQHFRHALLNTVRLVIPAMIIIVLIAPFVLQIFGGDYASEGTMLLRLLALAAIPNSVVTLYLGWLRVQNRIGMVVIIQWLIAIASLSLSYIWLQNYGITGVGMAWFVVQFTVATILSVTEMRLIFSRHYTENVTTVNEHSDK